MNRSFAYAILFLASGSAAAGASAQTWSGAYIGGGIGANHLSHAGDTIVFDTNGDGHYGDTVSTVDGVNYFSPGMCGGKPRGATPADGCSRHKDRLGVNLRAGYDWQLSGGLVLGVVGEIGTSRFEDSVTAFSTYPDSYTFSRRIRNLRALRARVGYAFNGGWLAYATAGVAGAQFRRTFTTTNDINSFTATDGKARMGSQLGLGFEKQFKGRWAIGAEYLRTDIRDRGATAHAGPSDNTFASNPFLIADPDGTDLRRGNDRFKASSVMLTISYRFDAM